MKKLINNIYDIVKWGSHIVCEEEEQDEVITYTVDDL